MSETSDLLKLISSTTGPSDSPARFQHIRWLFRILESDESALDHNKLAFIEMATRILSPPKTNKVDISRYRRFLKSWSEEPTVEAILKHKELLPREDREAINCYLTIITKTLIHYHDSASLNYVLAIISTATLERSDATLITSILYNMLSLQAPQPAPQQVPQQATSQLFSQLNSQLTEQLTQQPVSGDQTSDVNDNVTYTINMDNLNKGIRVINFLAMDFGVKLYPSNGNGEPVSIPTFTDTLCSTDRDANALNVILNDRLNSKLKFIHVHVYNESLYNNANANMNVYINDILRTIQSRIMSLSKTSMADTINSCDTTDILNVVSSFKLIILYLIEMCVRYTDNNKEVLSIYCDFINDVLPIITSITSNDNIHCANSQIHKILFGKVKKLITTVLETREMRDHPLLGMLFPKFIDSINNTDWKQSYGDISSDIMSSIASQLFPSHS